MKRRFNIRTVLSLLLCVATVGLWVRSYSVQDSFGTLWYSQGCWHEVVSDYGCIDIAYSSDRHVGIVQHAVLGFWFALLSAVFFYLSRKTRPKPNPASAFPVEMDKMPK